MKKLTILIILFASTYIAIAQTAKPKAPEFALGNFTDDYGITFTINDTLWVQNGYAKYHIIKWNKKKQYLIARNDVNNKSDSHKYTRIDYMKFNNMEPFLWGFCLTVYKAETDKIAEKTAIADRKNPKKGCNGYPFSRMKRVDPISPIN